MTATVAPPGAATGTDGVDGLDGVLTLARTLLRHDTTNLPGPVRDCVLHLRDLLEAHGVVTTLVGRQADRPSLLARWAGRGLAEPLLLHAHVDVVPVAGQEWTHDPFSGHVADGVLWGRGAVDMKGQLAMMVCALLELTRRGERPAGDVVLAVVPDEESGGPCGARELVTDHASLLDGVRHAVGEDGGAFVDLGAGPPVHPIVVAEKRACWMRLELRGPGGHASRVAAGDTAGAALGRTLTALGGGELAHRVPAATRTMVERLAAVVPPEVAAALHDAVAGPGAGGAASVLPAAALAYLRTVTHHTAVPTGIDGRSATNVRPAAISLDVDGRLLPGADGTEQMLELVRLRLADHDVTGYDLSVLVEGEPLPEPDLGSFYGRLQRAAEWAEPDAVAVPMITTASTDARLFAGLGISCYGWFPAPGCGSERVRLHEPDERLPVAALTAGAVAYHRLLREAP